MTYPDMMVCSMKVGSRPSAVSTGYRQVPAEVPPSALHYEAILGFFVNCLHITKTTIQWSVYRLCHGLRAYI